MRSNLDTLLQVTADAKSLALIGSGKNAGKTSVLSALIYAYRDVDRSLVLTSAGFDGEDKDRLSGKVKPRVYLFPGMYAVTSQAFLRRATVDPEVIECFSHDTLFGPPVLIRAKHAGFIELSGPVSLADLIDINAYIRHELAKPLFIVDGALGRKGNAAFSYADSVILSVSAENDHPSQLVRRIERQFAWLSIPLVSGEDDPADTILLDGAVTDGDVATLLSSHLKKDMTLLLSDRANCFIGETMRRELAKRRIALRAKRGATLVALVFNPKREDNAIASSTPYMQALSQFTDVPILKLDVTPSIGRAL